ncbi:hypothetical protein Tco_0007613 [Tanacetum coccineum]
MMVSIPMTFPLDNSIEYLVSTIDGTMSLKGLILAEVRLLSTRIMSTSTHPIIILSNSDVEDDFSSTNTPDYTLASPDYFPASPGNTFSDPSEDLSKDLLASLTTFP